MPDDNARLMAGTLPDDPAADTDPMPAPGDTPLPPTLGTILGPAFARMRARRDGDEKPIPLPREWPTLTKKLHGGLWQGLYVLVGHTGAGKSQFCLQAALHAAQQGTPVLYVALEADETEFAARCVGVVADTPWNYLYFGDHSVLDHLFTSYGPALEHLPLHILFGTARGWNYTDLPAEAKRLREWYAKATPGATPGAQQMLVIVDFLQIVGAATPHEDFRERIGNAANAAAYVARQENAAVILASSTARANYDKLTGAEGGLGEGAASRFVGLGKESGDIESSADGVLVLTQEPWPDPTTPPDGGTVCHLAIAKGRKVIPTWVEFRFNGHRFTEPPDKTPLPGGPTR